MSIRPPAAAIGKPSAPMADSGSAVRLPATLSILGVALFWTGVLVGGALAPGYRQSQDYISALASRGSVVAPIGMAAIASKGLAYMAGSWLTRRVWGRRALALPMLLAGASLLVVAAFRIGCPGGAAGCGFGAAALADDSGDLIHYYAVLSFEIWLLCAMTVLALGALRGAPWPRWLGWASAPLAVASVTLLTRTGGAYNGVWQRLWAGNNSLWLLLVVGVGVAGRAALGSGRGRAG